jgi:hypothetical protein
MTHCVAMQFVMFDTLPISSLIETTAQFPNVYSYRD